MTAHSLSLSLPAQLYRSLLPFNLVVVHSLLCLVPLRQALFVEPCDLL